MSRRNKGKRKGTRQKIRGPKARFFMQPLSRYLPNGMPVLNNKFYVRFCSADPYPWYQASALVTDVHEARQRFAEFVADVHAYEKLKVTT